MVTWPTDSTERLLAFQREVNRLFRRFFEDGARAAPPALTGDSPDIRVDIYDRDSMLVVQIEVPGVPRQNLRLSVSRDLMVVEGEKPMEDRGRVQYHFMERDFGKFRQVIEIPAPINTGKLKASHSSGVLTITAPLIVEDRRGARRNVEIQDEEA